MSRDGVRAIALLCGLLTVACEQERPPYEHVEPVAAAAHSNVLLILLDDVSTDRLGCYGEHPRPARTPTIDRLADQGTRFTRAYATAICSPTRAALLTGRHGRRTGVQTNFSHRSERALSLEEDTIPEMLAASRVPYTSAGVGKWHLSGRRQQGVDEPLQQGFDYYAGNIGNLHPYEEYDDYHWETDEGVIDDDGGEYLTTREIDEAIALVEALPEPWFLYLALHAPHAPWASPPPHLLSAPVDPDAPVPDVYDAMLEAADTELARLLAKVDLEDTLVLLIGDNGTPRDAVRPPGRPNASKGTMFEGGIRVPWIVAGPGVQAGRVEDALVHVVDVLPTLAAAAGLDPHRRSVPIDGQSLWPTLLGEPHVERSFMYTENPGRGREPSQALVGRRFKVTSRNGRIRGFYDLQGRTDDGPNLLHRDLDGEQLGALRELVDEMHRIEQDLGGGGAGCAR